MHRFAKVTVAAASVLCFGLAVPASAQALKDKITGVWTLVSGSESYPDGKKNMPWATGNMTIDSSGHLAFFLVGKGRPKTSPSVRTPVGPFVAYYGACTVEEPDTLTCKVEQAGAPQQNGTTRTEKITFNGDTMTETGSQIKTPEGRMTPVNVWKKIN